MKQTISASAILTRVVLLAILICCTGQSVLFAQRNELPQPQDKYQGLTPERKKLKVMLDSHFYDKLVEMENKGDVDKPNRSLADYSDQMFQIDAKNRVKVEIGVPELRPEYASELKQNGFDIVSEVPGFHRYDGWLPVNAVYRLANMEFVSFVRAVERPATKNASKGGKLHRCRCDRSRCNCSCQ